MDWTGNKKTTFVQLASSNHSKQEREENDYYATEPLATELLLDEEELENVWECASGGGHMANILESHGVLGKATDLIDRGCDFVESGVDFLNETEKWNGDIVTNPPYKYAQEFVEKAIELIPNGRKVAMFLKIQFLEGQKRKKLFAKYPPKTVYVSSKRLNCARNGDFGNFDSSAVCYAWYVWEKGWNGNTTIKWIN